jgi:hypothetical protein
MKFQKKFAAVQREYLGHSKQKMFVTTFLFWLSRSAALTQWNPDQSGSTNQNFYSLFTSFITGGLQFQCTLVICCCLSCLSVQSVFEC